MKTKETKLPKVVNMNVTQSDIVDYVVTKELAGLEPLLNKEKLVLAELEDAFHKKAETILIEYAKKFFTVVLAVLKPNTFNVIYGGRDYRTSDMLCDFMGVGGFGSDHCGNFYYKEDSKRRNEMYLITDNAMLRFLVPEEVKKEIALLEDQIKSMKKIVNELQNKVSNIKNNTANIKAHLVARVLSSSAEGRKLLEQLQSIDLSNPQQLLKG